MELYTEPFARAYAGASDAGQRSFQRYVDAANLAHGLGLGVNAGHDLDLLNLTLFRSLPHLDEVSIGHALMSRALSLVSIGPFVTIWRRSNRKLLFILTTLITALVLPGELSRGAACHPPHR